MDFADRLHLVLKVDDHDDNDTQLKLGTWNNDIEAYLAAPPTSQPSPLEATGGDEHKKETIEKLALELQKGIIGAIGNELETNIVDNDVTEEELEEMARLTKEHYLQTKKEMSLERLFENVRASKNLLRWFLQIYLEQQNGPVMPSPIRKLQSPAMLDLLVAILEHKDRNMDHTHQELSRNISLYLFYATYIPFPSDLIAQKALVHLMTTLSFTDLTLRILTRPCTAALALSLVRNIHNAIATLQGAAKVVLTAKIDWDGSSSEEEEQAAAAWAPKESGSINFRSICICLIRWSLGSGSSSEPPFPGDENDKRGELVVEILGAFYALRAGQELIPSRCDPSLMQLVADVLKFPNIPKDKRIDQCRLSTISLLMDTDKSFGDYLLQADAAPSLLEILESQVDDVLENTRVDNSAAATLVPILAVLNKFCSGSVNAKDFQQMVKMFVFPLEAEETFQEKAREQRALTTTNNIGDPNNSKTNMSPLDAPKGTFRWKLCKLMTWPEGHIKRCTGELLWTLCSSDAAEFAHRVGFGNALPILSVKGYAQMPTGS